MKFLKNWDNNTWLSSKKYILEFNKFLKFKINFNKDTKVLDIGCGRANIISALQNEYKFNNKAIGVDVVKNRNIKKNIVFNKIDAIKFLRKNKSKFDLILIKQTVHFFPTSQLKILLDFAKERLKTNGKLLIFTLNTKNIQIPCFKKMKLALEKSLERDELLLKKIRKNLKKTKETYFQFKVIISSKKYINMLKSRYISCLLDISKKDLDYGINEIKLKYKNKIKFLDVLKCISFNK